MDTYNEQIVSKGSASSDKLQKASIIALTLVFCIFLFFFVSYLLSILMGLLVAGLAFYGGYFLITGLECEYEYIVTNGELDIDKIIGRRKRKRLVSIKAHDFTGFGQYMNAPNLTGTETRIIANDGILDTSYYADFNISTLGQTRLIFSPNQKIIDGLTPYLPRNLK